MPGGVNGHSETVCAKKKKADAVIGVGRLNLEGANGGSFDCGHFRCFFVSCCKSM